MQILKNKIRRRFVDIALVAASNGLVIFAALYYEWSLFEVTLAYAGEFVILLLVVSARILAAKIEPFSWKSFSAKLAALLMAWMLYPLVTGLIVLLSFGSFDVTSLPEKTLKWLALCWLGFFVSHAIAFVSLARVGAYSNLISDGRVMMPLLRYPLLLVAAIGVGHLREFGSVEPWFFVLVLAMMALVNSAAHIVELDALRATPGVPEDAEPAE